MDMNEQAFRELCLTHALGGLDAQGEKVLMRALESASEQRLEFFAEAVNSVRNSDPQSAQLMPSAGVKERILSLATAEPAENPIAKPASKPQPERPPSASPTDSPLAWFRKWLGGLQGFQPGFAIAMASFGAGLLVHALFTHHRNPPQREALKESGGIGDATADSLNVRKALLSVLSSPQLRVARLTGQGSARNGFGKVLWDPHLEQGILQVANLPPAPTGQVYQLWILVDDKADPCVNAGAFSVQKASWDGELFRFQGKEPVTKLKLIGFEVTLEPKTGHPHPVGPSLLRSETFL